jgi:hypothetical protein
MGTNARIQRKIDVTPMEFIDFGINGASSNQGLGFGVNNTTNMVLTSGGDLGIGTTSPGAKLDIAGNMRIKSTADAGYGTQISTLGYSHSYGYSATIFEPLGYSASYPSYRLVVATPSGATPQGGGVLFRTGTTMNGQIVGNTNGLYIDVVGSTSPIIFRTSSSSTPRLTIDSIGKIYTNGAYSGSAVGGDFSITRIGRTDAAIYFGPSANYLYWYGNRFAKTGSVGWVENSDERVKTEIQPLSYGLNEILQLQPKTYNLHNDYSFVDGEIVLAPESYYDMGLIAQDVYNIIPELVTKPPDENSDIWHLSYAGLTPILINAVKEQQSQINSISVQLDDVFVIDTGKVAINYNGSD